MDELGESRAFTDVGVVVCAYLIPKETHFARWDG